MAKLADALLGLAQAAIVVERATASSTAFLTKIKVLIIYATHCDFCEREFRTTLIRVFWNALESPFGMERLGNPFGSDPFQKGVRRTSIPGLRPGIEVVGTPFWNGHFANVPKGFPFQKGFQGRSKKLELRSLETPFLKSHS